MTVYLVGAGPGDPGLLTVRAKELIDAADVILYDRLIPPGILDGVGAELVYVGKQGGGPQMPQEEIDRLLVQYGTGGRTVVRLKGGDPFVFGRGGEEALVLRNAGIPFEVVPGITAGIAAPAYAGVPVTHRELASGVAFVTGHENPDKPETALDWPALAAFPGTLVFYMGVQALPRIASQLIAGGRSSDEPVAVVERGTLPGQATVLSTLSEIGSVKGIRAPAITLVGPVAALREQIAWLETRPLHGRSVAVTRARVQASALVARLRGLGAEVIEAPAIRTRALPVELPDVRSYDLLCVTSPTGADQLFEHLRDARDLAGVTVAAIGPGTARALRAHGVEADIVPERAVAEGLVEALDAAPATGSGAPGDAAAAARDGAPRNGAAASPGAASFPFARVLVARAKQGRDVLIDALRERGAHVDIAALYETVAEPLDDATREAASQADYLLFTSASSVRFFAAAGGALAGPRLASIGPATSAELREHGAEPDLEADPHTPDGLVAALFADAVSSPRMTLGQPREHHETIGSTNERARELAEEGAAHGALVTAGEQTAGRGRQGRGWVTPAGVAIAASLVLRDYDELLPLRAGLAVADVAGPRARVKWPNDVWIEGRKVAGILAEARGQDWAVLGIGVNVALDPETLPPDVAAIAGTLGRDAAQVEPTLVELLSALEQRLSEDRDATLAALRDRDALLGQHVRWQDGEGTGAGIDANGALLVNLADGSTTALSAGEVTLSN